MCICTYSLSVSQCLCVCVFTCVSVCACVTRTNPFHLLLTLTPYSNKVFGGRRLLTAPRLSVNSLRPAAVLDSSARANAYPASVIGAGGSGSGDSGASGSMFWKRLETDALQLEDLIQQGAMRGLTIDTIDQYARQVTLRLEPPGGTVSGASSGGLDGRSLALIARFPARSPPAFVVRGLNAAEAAVGMYMCIYMYVSVCVPLSLSLCLSLLHSYTH